MESISHQRWAFSPGITAAGKAFVEKWLELLNPLTVDNFRVRHLNARIAVYELSEAIRDADNKILDPQNIEDISRELLQLLKSDSIARSSLPHLDYYYESLVNPFKDKEKKAAHSGLKVLIGQANDVLGRRYRADLIVALKETIHQDDVERTIHLTSMLVSDLVASGYDFRHLLWRGRSFINRPTRSFDDRLSFFLEQVRTASLQRYLVAYRIDFPHVEDAANCPDLIGTLKVRSASTVGADHPSLISHIPGDNVRLATLTTDALDPFAATRKGSSELHRALDLIQFAKPSVEIISQKTAFVVQNNGTIKSIPTPLELLGPIRIAADEFEHRISQLTRIRQRVEESSVRQLGLGLQYLRRGLTESAPQSQFLNYWIGLEVIAGGNNRTEIVTTRKCVPRMIALGYPRRLLRDLQENFKRLSINIEDALLQFPAGLGGPWGKVEALFRCIADERGKATLMGLAEPSPLLKCRIQETAAIFGNASAVARSMESHRQDIDWHVQRLYRVRNAIVHGGSAPADLTHLASNLATYLWVILRSLLDDFALSDGTSSVTKFFDKHLKIYEMVSSKLNALGPQAEPPFGILIEPTSIWPTN